MNRIGPAFTTGIGQHNMRSFAKDLGMDKLVKKAKAATAEMNNGGKGLSDKDFINMVPEILNTGSLSDIGIKIGTQVTAKMLDSAFNYIINGPNNNSRKNPSGWTTNTISLKSGKWLTIDGHVGHPNSSRIKKAPSINNLSSTTKILSSSKTDFDNRRNALDFKCGFNQKKHIFFMEETFMRVKEIERFGEKEIERLVKEKLEERREQIYLMGKKVKNWFQFKNMDLKLPCKITIKMCLLKDITKNLLDTILLFTNNENQNLPSKVSILEKKLKEIKEEIVNIQNDESAAKATKTKKTNSLNEKYDKILREKNEIKYKHLLGVIDEKYQLSNPKYNSYACEFITTKNCELDWYGEFKNNIQVVQYWTRTLEAGDTLNFNMTKHMGKGINLNTFVEHKGMNADHPIGYFFYVEIEGARDCGIIREHKKRGEPEPHFGSNPVNIHTEFTHEFTYIKHNDDIDETPASYRKESNDGNYLDNTSFANEYQKNRMEKLNVNYESLYNNKDYDEDGYKYSIASDGSEHTFDDTYFERMREILAPGNKKMADNVNLEDKPFTNGTQPSVPDDELYNDTSAEPPTPSPDDEEDL